MLFLWHDSEGATKSIKNKFATQGHSRKHGVERERETDRQTERDRQRQTERTRNFINQGLRFWTVSYFTSCKREGGGKRERERDRQTERRTEL